MRCRVILNNNNEILSESSREAHYNCLNGKYAINLMISGQSDFRIGNRKLRLTAGNFLFINSNTSYSYQIDSLEPAKIMTLLFDESFVVDFHRRMQKNNSSLSHVLNVENETAPNFLESIHSLQGDMAKSLRKVNAYVSGKCNNEEFLHENFHGCLLAYYKLYEQEITQRAFSLDVVNMSTRSEILKRLMIAKDYILSNYNHSITLKDIASMACLSVNHLLRTFKQVFKVSPHQFLMHARLQQARYLLESTDYPVKEVVEMVGFENPSSFIRLFKNVFRDTPGKYKEEFNGIPRMEIFAYH